mmetsp:Transcript_32424/g.41551  ORF Transcript_32424/g.41551 Transcript_32424/m.41551 type:complete len:147 (+) Transcript_32424:50-490(+)
MNQGEPLNSSLTLKVSAEEAKDIEARKVSGLEEKVGLVVGGILLFIVLIAVIDRYWKKRSAQAKVQRNYAYKPIYMHDSPDVDDEGTSLTALQDPEGKTRSTDNNYESLPGYEGLEDEDLNDDSDGVKDLGSSARQRHQEKSFVAI